MVIAALGLANYFRRFMQGYAKLVQPLTNLLKQTQQWGWSEECEQAFQHIKYALTSAPVLTIPDLNGPFEVITDASGDVTRGALGAVLMQNGIGGRI